eukprot:CAMPEP_0119168302 /NCGR_PEP_ID=MMETSP1315-20130426/7127_1 /TAXON_ID=676789 /ORGANISM="Prasinoderma singularis, Strain RCC927" /LENGTH=60 /DNA_ID=CAMNT_0007161803 /DNA_START=148 /DNA_END=327 /DNA_ORIENTATION=+
MKIASRKHRTHEPKPTSWVQVWRRSAGCDARTGAPTRQPAPTRVLVSRGKHAATSHAGSC